MGSQRASLAGRASRIRRAAGPVPVLLALVLAGCSSATGGTAADGSPAGATGTASATTANGTATVSTSTASTPSPTATPAPTATCYDTAMVGDSTAARFLTRLLGPERPISPGIVMDLDGLHLKTTNSERTCGPVTLRITRFTVRIAGAGPATATHSVYDYRPLDSITVTLGPADGLAPNSAPPAPSACTAVLSVAHLGDPVKDSQLPKTLPLGASDPAPTKPYAITVKVQGDTVVAAGLVVPPTINGC
ncbi:hypothetical protein OH807_39185 [Kitasatospora sp. NBC_01560]|uniref:hypothetical protein n=1 Tax=Kitasatospora sp. NBC_01560 TaxID=2975965 RepID=UPI00386DF61D